MEVLISLTTHKELRVKALMQEFWGVCKGMGGRNDEKMQLGLRFWAPQENRRILEEKIPGRRACEERERVVGGFGYGILWCCLIYKYQSKEQSSPTESEPPCPLCVSVNCKGTHSSSILIINHSLKRDIHPRAFFILEQVS